MGGNILFTEKITGRRLSSYRIQRAQTRSAVANTERLIKSDVTIATDAQQLQINATRRLDAILEIATLGINLFQRNGALGNVNVFRPNVDVGEQMFLHPPVIAL